MTERAAGEPTEGYAMTEAKQQEAGRTRFLLLPPLSAAEREAERERERGRNVWSKGELQQSRDRGGIRPCWTPGRNPMIPR
jgi:hypothetical protein